MKKHSLLKSFGFAFNGLKEAWFERNFKLHMLSTLVVIGFGFVFKITAIDWIIILICIALVLSLELINTAIEHLVDIISPEFNEKAGKVKDISAAAVLLASIAAFIIGFIVFLPYL